MSNVILNPGAGGATLGTDLIGGIDYQIVKISFSTAGNAPVQVDAANGLPVVGTFWQATQPVSGTFWQATQPVSGSVSVSNFPATQPVSGTVSTTPPANASTNVAQLGGSAVVTGTGTAGAGIPRVTVSSDSFPATQAVSAASLPLPTGAATSTLQSTINTTLGTPMQQSGGSLSVTNFPASQAVTGTFFQATQPVSAASLPLPANAAQEASGNLALVMQGMWRLIDINTQILATLQAMQLQDASAYGIQVEPSIFMNELLQ